MSAVFFLSNVQKFVQTSTNCTRGAPYCTIQTLF